MEFLKSAQAGTKSRSGSALVLTLLVVSLLVVMVLAFSVFVRLELRAVALHQQFLQARANAVLGANLALARLQELAGPDTRVTTPTLPAAGGFPNAAHIGRAIDAAPYTISGPSLAYNSRFAQTLGHLISHDPAQSFDPLAYQPFAAGGLPSAGNALLVGPGSVSASADENNDGIPDAFVAAPYRRIEGGASGAYAWWIGDNGLKAQINLTDPRLESTGLANARAQAATAQRLGAERVLPAYNPANPIHNTILKRAVAPGQLNLTGYGDPEFSRKFFHDVTLQSLGLSANPRQGGLKRDLTAVIKEAEANGGNINPSGAQWTQLMDYQQARLSRWREEAVALPASAPAGLPERHWNALRAIRPRAEQADARLQDRIFPPLSDLHIQWDMGGASWEQLITWVTFRQRRSPSGGAVPPAVTYQDRHELSPVLAKVMLSAYFTVDWPDVAMHWIPAVVVWNPYDIPLAMNPARPWRVHLNYDTTVFGNYTLRFKVRNNRWSAPNTAAFSHIVPKDELWTPGIPFYWRPSTPSTFVFNLKDAAGTDSNLVIPPGEARIFAMRRHQRVTLNIPGKQTSGTREWIPIGSSYGQVNPTCDLWMGLSPDGLFGLYGRYNLNDQIVYGDAAGYRPPAQDDRRGPANTIPDINERDGKTYSEAAGGYNEWHTTTRRDGYKLPYPFPLNTNKLAQASSIGSLVKIPPPADLDICINENGLNGWDILEIGAELGRKDQPSSNLRNTNFALLDGTETRLPLFEVIHPNQQLPAAIHGAYSYDSPSANGRPRVNPVWTPIRTPADNQPFTPATPGFPAWGLSYGLRLPDHSYTFNATTNQGSAVAAPIRWLADFNPAAPFQMRDPASRLPSPGGWRDDRYGMKGTPMFVGGFFMGDNRYADLSWTTPNDRNQFIGHSDDSLPGYAPGMIPRAILYETPRGSEDLASIAAFQHAPLHLSAHALLPSPLPTYNSNWGLGTRSMERRFLPYALAWVSTNHHYMQPAHTIGNSFARLLVARDRAIQSFYPSTTVTTPEPVPHAATTVPTEYSGTSAPSYFPGYDAPWLYNTVLWDDFFLTPDANSLLAWQPPWTSAARDFTLSAQRLFVRGAFNVNTTSVTAWAVLLSSMLGVDLGTGDTPAGSAPFSRFLSPPHPAFHAAVDDYESPAAYLGHRRLTTEQINRLAEEIVVQVKRRGPFLSLADFVNRALLPEAQDPHGLGLSGALQSAIDNAGLNDPMGSNALPTTWINPSTDYAPASSFSGLSPGNAVGRRNASAAGVLTQADVLARIGSVLSARSDTFTIRAKGLLGDMDSPTAQAWCELIVQRLPDYVDPAQNAPGDLPAALTPVNRAFGRRFEVIAFRWLTAEEI